MSARSRQRVDRVAGALAAVVAAGVALSVLAGVMSGGAWPWVMATYLRWPQVVAMVVATGVLVVTRWWRSAVPSAVVTAALIMSVVSPLRALTTVPAPQDGTVRIAVFNTGARETDITAVATAIAEAQPDVAVLLESEDIAAALDDRLDGLTRLPTSIGDGPILSPPVVLARRDWPVDVVPLADGRPAAIVEIEVDGAPLDVVAAHPLPPVTPRWTGIHNRSIAALAREVLPRDHPYVLACDCNAAPWSPSLRRLLDAGLRGPTVAATFGAPLIGVPNDHVLLGRDVAAVSRELGPFAGSDHRLIVTEVTLDR